MVRTSFRGIGRQWRRNLRRSALLPSALRQWIGQNRPGRGRPGPTGKLNGKSYKPLIKDQPFLKNCQACSIMVQMKTIWDPNRRQEILARIEKLTPERRPAWGMI